MRPSLFAAVRRECRPSLIQTPSHRNGQGPQETIQRRLFVHEYPCMAALGSGAAIGKSAGLFRETLAGSLRKQDDAGDDQSRQNETGARGLAIARSWHGCADEITPK